MISPRHAPALCIVAALALVPAVIHGYIGVRAGDGRTSAAIPAVLAGFAGQPSGRNATWGKRRFDSDDWVERRYLETAPDRAGLAAEVTLTVIRSYDLKALYHHPELAVAYGHSFTSYDVTRLPGQPDMPVHVLRGTGEGGRAAALYVLHYGDTFVERPLLFQVQVAGRLLVSPRRPMTLFFLTVPGAGEDASVEQLPAAQLLTAAVDSFLAQGS